MLRYERVFVNLELTTEPACVLYCKQMVLVDFRLDDWGFWLVLLFDIFLLIMRDADLWTDFAALVQRKSGSFGSFLLSMGKTASGECTHPFNPSTLQGC